MNACRGAVLSGKAFMGHVLVMLIAEVLWSLAPGRHKVSSSSSSIKATWRSLIDVYESNKPRL